MEPVGCRRRLPRVREGCSPCPSRALAFSAASRSTVHRPAPKTPTGRPFRDGPSSLSADTPSPQTQKAPDALASGACMPWWSCVNKNHTFYTINSKCYIFVKIGIPTKIPTLYFHAMEPMPPVPLLPLHPGLAFALPSSVSPPPARFSSPAGIAFAPCSSGCRYQLLSPTHGLGFPLSILRFRLGHFPLAAERRFPSSVFGPVESPPCRRHRPLL